MEDRKVPVFSWIFTFIMLIIPIVNIIYFIVLLFGGSQYKSKVTYIRAQFVSVLLIVGIVFGIMYLMSGQADGLIEQVKQIVANIMETITEFINKIKN